MTATVIAFPTDRSQERVLAEYAKRRIKLDSQIRSGEMEAQDIVRCSALIRLEGEEIAKRLNLTRKQTRDSSVITNLEQYNQSRKTNHGTAEALLQRWAMIEGIQDETDKLLEAMKWRDDARQYNKAFSRHHPKQGGKH
ncbi:hypothetical protein [Pontibacterium sp.]|uniref:hypothetical protein n=1 Tax=Pontibacterium sp. TaxID=2036026 RepID=UPI003518A40C